MIYNFLNKTGKKDIISLYDLKLYKVKSAEEFKLLIIKIIRLMAFLDNIKNKDEWFFCARSLITSNMAFHMKNNNIEETLNNLKRFISSGTLNEMENEYVYLNNKYPNENKTVRQLVVAWGIVTDAQKFLDSYTNHIPHKGEIGYYFGLIYIYIRQREKRVIFSFLISYLFLFILTLNGNDFKFIVGIVLCIDLLFNFIQAINLILYSFSYLGLFLLLSIPPYIIFLNSYFNFILFFNTLIGR